MGGSPFRKIATPSFSCASARSGARCNRDLQPPDCFGQGLLLERQRPEVERRFSRRSRHRVFNSRQLFDRLAGATGPESALLRARAGWPVAGRQWRSPRSGGQPLPAGAPHRAAPARRGNGAPQGGYDRRRSVRRSGAPRRTDPCSTSHTAWRVCSPPIPLSSPRFQNTTSEVIAMAPAGRNSRLNSACSHQVVTPNKHGAGRSAQRHEQRHPVAIRHEEEDHRCSVHRNEHRPHPIPVVVRAQRRPAQADQAKRQKQPGTDGQDAEERGWLARVERITVVEWHVDAVEQNPDLAYPQPERIGRMFGHPVECQPRKVAGHLAGRKAPTRTRFGHASRIAGLSSDRWRDARHGRVGPVGAIVVADVEIQPAVRGNQDDVPGHGEIACRVGGKDGEQSSDQHRAAFDPAVPPLADEHNGGGRHSKHERVGSIESEQSK